MKNQLFVIGSSLLLLIAGLSGCTEEKSGDGAKTSDHASKFIGTWNVDLEGNVSGHTPSFECIEETWTFYTNGTLEILTTYEEGGGIAISKSTWYLEDGRLRTIANYNFAYAFANGDTHLVLSGTIWSGAEKIVILDKVN